MQSSVLVKISRSSLNFWYYLEGAGSKYNTLSIRGETEVPLYFCLNNNEILFGQHAKDLFLEGDPRALPEYFELIKDPSRTFRRFDTDYSVTDLILHGVEIYLSHFQRTVLRNPELMDPAVRKIFCLRLWFDHDVELSERDTILTLFKNFGYENIEEININEYINAQLSKETNSSHHRLILSSRNRNIYAKFYNAPNYHKEQSLVLYGQGFDPAVTFMTKLILEDIRAVHPHITFDEDQEMEFLIPQVTTLLKDPSPLISGNITISSQHQVSFRVRYREVEERLAFHRGVEDKVISPIRDFLGAENISCSNVDIYLFGAAINNNFFKGKFISTFPSVVGIDEPFFTKVLKDVFDDIANSGFKPFSEGKGSTPPNTPPTPPRPPGPPPIPPRPTPPPGPIPGPPPRPTTPPVPPIPPRPAVPSAPIPTPPPRAAVPPPPRPSVPPGHAAAPPPPITPPPPPRPPVPGKNVPPPPITPPPPPVPPAKKTPPPPPKKK
jgi:hypothetical protein